MIGAAYLAAEGYERPLACELAQAGAGSPRWHGRLALTTAPAVPSCWALDVWLDPVEHEIASIKQASDILRGVQRNWSLYAVDHYRRSALIGDRLPPVRSKPLVGPQPAPQSHLGAWTLLAPSTLLHSAHKTSPFPDGAPAFVEDRQGPPSRAYLKLWEAWTQMGVWPAPGESCLDLGAAPGGWTWAAAKLGAGVLAIDRAPLDPAVAALPGVTWREGSAFTHDPHPVDWLLCDVIAYPDKTLELVRRWIAAGVARHIVCTIKFQGEADYGLIDAFTAIGGSVVRHLAHNKHELTFMWRLRAA